MVPSLAYYLMNLRNEFVAYSTKRLQEIQVSQGQLFFLLYIGKHDGCSPKQLALALQMDQGHATRTITKLIANGFLVQKENREDRRAHTLHLTNQGQEAFQLAYELFHEWDAQVLKNFKTEDREVLMHLLAELCKQVSNQDTLKQEMRR